MKRTKIDRKEIAVIQLQNDIGLQSLKARAAADVLAKTLFQHFGEPLSTGRLTSKAAGFIGIDNLPTSLADEALKYLSSQGWVENVKGWTLTEEKHTQIKERLSESNKRIDRILDKHFGQHIERVVLKNWFLQAATEFLAEHGIVLSKALLREEIDMPSKEMLATILDRSITASSLSTEKAVLVKGFHSFLEDLDPEIGLQKLSFAQKTLSARLIAAAAGKNPVSAMEFEDCSLLLDTNVVLLENVLMRNPEITASFVALAKSLQGIGAKLHIIRPTKEEYERLIQGKREQTLRVIDAGASIGVLEKSADPFLKMAVKNMARDRKGFEQYFDSIAEVPTSIGGVPVTLLEHPELNAELEKAKRDGSKKKRIASETKKIRGREKSLIATEHDVCLDAAALFVRKTEGKGGVITRDRAMLNYSRQQHSKDDTPPWTYLDALAQIIAVNGAGPHFNPTEFTPLLGALLHNGDDGGFSNFYIEDLAELVDIDDRALELDDEEVVGFATKVHQMKASGIEVNSSEFQSELRRTFQGRRIKDNVAAQRMTARLQGAEARADLSRQIGIAALIKQATPIIKRRMNWQRFVRTIPYIVLGLGIIAGMIWAPEAWFTSLVIALVIDILVPLIRELFFSPINKAEFNKEVEAYATELWKAEQVQLKTL